MSIVRFDDSQKLEDTGGKCQQSLTHPEEYASPIPPLYHRLAKELGNGDELRGFILLDMFLWRLIHARQKHPRFADGTAHALAVIGSEYGELAFAIEHESQYRQQDEALDLMVTAFRFAAGEYI